MTEDDITKLVSEFEAAVQCQARVDAVPSLARVYVAYDVEAAANALREKLLASLRDARQYRTKTEKLWDAAIKVYQHARHAQTCPAPRECLCGLWDLHASIMDFPVASSGTPGEQQP